MHARSAGGSSYDMAGDARRFDTAAILAAAELVGQGTFSLYTHWALKRVLDQLE
jgi:hypothetical protein